MKTINFNRSVWVNSLRVGDFVTVRFWESPERDRVACIDRMDEARIILDDDSGVNRVDGYSGVYPFKITPLDRPNLLRLPVHVFRFYGKGVRPSREIQIWECDYSKVENDGEGGDINPTMLIAEDGTNPARRYLLSLCDVQDRVAIFNPIATAPGLFLLEDLPKFGWERVE